MQTNGSARHYSNDKIFGHYTYCKTKEKYKLRTLSSKQSILLLLSFLKQISFHTKVQIQVHCIHQINTSKH